VTRVLIQANICSPEMQTTPSPCTKCPPMRVVDDTDRSRLTGSPGFRSPTRARDWCHALNSDSIFPFSTHLGWCVSASLVPDPPRNTSRNRPAPRIFPHHRANVSDRYHRHAHTDPFAKAVTVRQTPLTAMLSPILTSDRMTPFLITMMVRMTPPETIRHTSTSWFSCHRTSLLAELTHGIPCFSSTCSALICPISSTNPVNMAVVI